MLEKLLVGAILLSCFSISCSNSSSEAVGPKSYYKYGSESFVGSLSPLDSSYKPAHLNAKVFTKSGISYAPMNIEDQDLILSFDTVSAKVYGQAVLHFFPDSALSYSIFQLEGAIASAKLNGDPLF